MNNVFDSVDHGIILVITIITIQIFYLMPPLDDRLVTTTKGNEETVVVGKADLSHM